METFIKIKLHSTNYHNWGRFQMEENIKKATNKKVKRGSAKDFPVIKFNNALKVAQVIRSCGGYASPKTLETGLGAKGGNLARQIASAKRWGLVDGHGELKITELAKRIMFPTSSDDVEKAKKEAFNQIEFFKQIYDRFNGTFPEDRLFKNILIREHSLTEKEATRVVNIIKDAISGFENLPNAEETTEEHKSETVKAKPKVVLNKSTVPAEDFKVIGTLFYLKSLIENKCELSEEEKNEQIDKLLGIAEKYPSLKIAITPMANLLKNKKISQTIFLGEINSF